MTPSTMKFSLPAPVPSEVAVGGSVIGDSGVAANEDTATAPAPNDLRNPLWIIAIGMACFFGGIAALMVLS